MGLWGQHVAPHLVDLACGAKPIGYQRRKIVPQAHGVVLEIGAGGGRNFAHYDRDRVERLIALEPDAVMLRKARERAPADLPIDWIEAGAENAALEAGSVDSIVTTFTLCTIPDAVGALAALHPVLKPGGRLLFCEHGLAPDATVQAWQRRLEPLWKPLAGGCRLTRDVPALLASAGWRIEQAESMYLPSTPRMLGWNVWGSAVPLDRSMPAG